MGLSDMDKRNTDVDFQISGVFVDAWEVNAKLSKQKQSNLLSEICMKLSKKKSSLLMQQASMANSLDLKDIRKEQRRVAALLGHEYRSKPYIGGDVTHRSEIINFCICNGPDVAKSLCSMHKDKRNRKTEYTHHPSKSSLSARSKSVDSAELQRIKQEERDNVYLRGQSITPHCRSPTIIRGLPNIKVHDKIKGQDIENFDYTLLGDTVTKELGGPDSLPGIIHKNYNRPQKGLDVPDNSPLVSARRKKKRRDNKLPSIHGNTTPRNSITVFINGLNENKEFSGSKEFKTDSLNLRTNEKHSHDYCQCLKPHPNLTSVNSSSSVNHSQSDKSELQRCLKCGKIISEIPELQFNDGPLQGYFDPHASLDNELQHSFISNHSAIDSLSSGSFRMIRDEFNNGYREHLNEHYENFDNHEQIVSKKEKKVKNKNPSEPLIGHESSLPEHEYDYNPQSHSEVVNESNPINTSGSLCDTISTSSNKNKKMSKFDSRLELYEDGHKEAYIKALAMARIQKLPLEPWMLSARISKSHEFSYFQPFPYSKRCKCMPRLTKNGNDHSLHKLKPKKHIFGNLDVDDFYPGGKRNPLEMRRKYEQNT